MELWTLYPVADYDLLECDPIIKSQHFEAIYCVQIPWMLWPLKRTLRCLQNTGIQLFNNAASYATRMESSANCCHTFKILTQSFVHMHEQAQESECAPKMKVTDNIQNFGHNYKE